MNNYDLEQYEIGGSNAKELEQRMRQAGVWPENPYLSTKMLRRELRILRTSDLADQTAFVSIINHKEDEQVRLRYWRDRAPRLYQDKNFFDWPKTELSIEEMKERLSSAGIESQIIEEDLKKVLILAKAKREKIAAKNERRQKAYLKDQKCRRLLDIKYKQLLSKVEKEHGLSLEYLVWGDALRYKVRIIWRPEQQNNMILWSCFSVYRDYSEEESSTAFPSVINAILQVVDLSNALIIALQRTGTHLSFVDKKLMVMSGHRRRFHRLRDPFEEVFSEEIVTEGEDVDLAARLYEKVNEAELSLCVF